MIKLVVLKKHCNFYLDNKNSVMTTVGCRNSTSANDVCDNQLITVF